jgi:hypothetical protein
LSRCVCSRFMFAGLLGTSACSFHQRACSRKRPRLYLPPDSDHHQVMLASAPLFAPFLFSICFTITLAQERQLQHTRRFHVQRSH